MTIVFGLQRLSTIHVRRVTQFFDFIFLGCMKWWATLSLIFVFNGLRAQNLDISERFSDTLHVCDTVNIIYIFTNGYSEDLHDVLIELQLPPGIHYVQGSVRGAEERPIGGEVKFFKSRLPQGRLDSMVLAVTADCEAKVKEGQKFTNRLTVSHDFGKTTFESNPPYSIHTAFLIISAVEPTDTIITAMHEARRRISITNTRLGRVKKFVLIDEHTPAEVRIPIGTVLDQSPTRLRVLIDSNVFKTIGNRDAYFDYDETLVVEEFLRLDSCRTGTITSDIRVQWGCNDEVCQEDLFTNAIVEVREYIERAQLQLSLEESYPQCPCQPAEQTLTICNEGISTATDVELVLEGFPFLENGVLSQSLWLEYGGDSIPLPVDKAFNPICKDIYEETHTVLPDIPGGECVVVRFSYAQCSMFDGVRLHDPQDLSITARVRYTTQCYETAQDSTYVQARTALDLRADIVVYQPSKAVEDGEIAYLQFDLMTRGLTRYTSGQLGIVYHVPCGFEPLPGQFLLGGRIPDRIDVEGGPGHKNVFAVYRLPFDSDTLRGYLTVQLNCDTPCLQRDSLTGLLHIKSSCPSGPLIHELEVVTEHCFLIFFSTCPIEDEGDICGYTRRSSSIETEIACHSGDTLVQYAPGYVDFTAEIERLSLGYADEDNDRLPDTPLVRAHPNSVNHHRYLEYDTLQLHLKGRIVSDDPTLQYQRLFVQSGLHPDFFVLDKASIRIVDRSSGAVYRCSSDSLDYIAGEGELNICNTSVRNASSSTAISVVFHPDYLKTRGCGLPDDFYFEDGDSIDITLTFVVSTVLSYSHGLLFQFKSRCYLFTDAYDHQPFYCGEYIDTILLGKLTYTVEQLGSPPDITPCGPSNAHNYYLLRMNPGMANFFPYEFRPIMYVDDIFYSIDPAISLDSFVLLFFYDTSDYKPFIIKKQRILPVYPTNTRDWSLPQSYSPLALDEAYHVLILPYITLRDCHDLARGFQDSIQRIRIITNSVPPSVYFYRFNRPELVRHQWSHTYTFDEELDYLQFKMQIPQTKLRSTSARASWKGIITTLDSALGEVRFKILHKSPQLKNVRIVDNTGRVFRQRGNIITVRPLTDSIQTLTIVADNQGCDWQYLTLISAWTCDTPGDFFSRACAIDTFHLSVKSFPPELEMDAWVSFGEMDLCDTLRYIELHLWNANRGAAYEVELDLFLPKGFRLLEDHLSYVFDSIGVIQPLPSPQQLASGIYRWNLTEVIDSFRKDGWPGVGDPLSKITIRLVGYLDCDFQPGTFAYFKVKGRNNCFEPTNTVRRNSPPIRVRLADPPDQWVSFDSSRVTPDTLWCKDRITVHVQLNASAPFSEGDKIQATLPRGFSYVPKSLRALQNFTPREPKQIATGSGTLLEWNAREVTIGHTDIAFQITLSVDIDSLSCEQYDIFLATTHRNSTLCKATGDTCAIDVITGSATLPIVVEKLRIERIVWDSFILDREEGLQLCFRLRGISGLRNIPIDKMRVLLKADLTGDGPSDDDITLGDWPISVDVSGDSGYLCYDYFFLHAFLYCYLYLELPSEGNCLCNTRYAPFVLNKQQQHYRDTLCPGQTLTIGIDKIHGDYFEWTGPNIDCPNCPSIELVHTFANDTSITQRYILTVYDSAYLIDSVHCQWQYIYDITYLPQYGLHLDTHQICVGDSIVLAVEDPRLHNVRWYSQGSDTIAQRRITVHPTRNVRWYVAYTDTNGCEGTSQVDIEVLQVDSQAFAIAPDTTIFKGGKAQLWVQGEGTFTWSPGESLSCTNCKDPEASPDTTTTYTVTIVDTNGCTTALQVTVFVLPPPCDPTSVFVPNAFSPNGDGVNDLLYVRGQNIDEIHFAIYNRWGEKVFETHDLHSPWDGSFKDKPLPPDVYAYYLHVRCIGGEEFVKKGNVTLLK